MKYNIQNGKITGKEIRNIINDHQKEHEHMRKLYERYKASRKGVPIFERSIMDHDEFGIKGATRIDDKVNNMLNNAFESDIVDTATGYFLGHPINYQYEGDAIKKEIDTFNLRNHVEDADSEWGKMAIICGKGARLAYIDKEGNERIKNIEPWQTIFIGDSIAEPDYSIRYYKDDKGVSHAEFYNDTMIQYFTDKDGTYEEETPKPHLFAHNPLYGLANNKEEQGDIEKVLSLIDAYNRTLSDASNEIEQYRLAYLVFKGITPDEETNDQMKRHKVIELLEKDDDVSYLTKDINDQLIEHHLERLEKNILKFAKSVDFTDEQFGSAASGVSLRYKLLALENKCVTKERKMTAALRYQFKVIFSAWAKRKGVGKDDYLNVSFSFKRNLPVNVLEESEITANLRGNVSEETRLAQLSIVANAKEELERMKKEQDEYMRNMPDVGDGNDTSQ